MPVQCSERSFGGVGFPGAFPGSGFEHPCKRPTISRLRLADVGVTAYKGASPFIHNKTYLEAAASILAVEAYHAATIRSTLFEKGVKTPALYGVVQKISDARDSLDGARDDDKGIRRDGHANIVPTDGNGVAHSRSAARVLNVLYLNPHKVSKGGFFPAGVHGAIRTSGGSAS